MSFTMTFQEMSLKIICIFQSLAFHFLIGFSSGVFATLLTVICYLQDLDMNSKRNQSSMI